MSSRKILEMIIGKLAEKINKDNSFEYISQDLVNKIGEQKHTKGT